MKSGISETGDNGKSSSDDVSVDGRTLFCCKSKKKKLQYTLKQRISLVMLCLAEFMSVCAMSIIAPFYPAVSAKKNVSESVSGLVFGAYALVIFLFSPVWGKVIPKCGVRFIFIAGLFISGISNMVFGLIDRFEDGTYFVIASFLIRVIEATGASAYGTASYVVVVNIFPENGGAVRGILETCVGLGVSVGPGIGGLLYGIGGFGLPFYVTGGITVLIALLNIFLLPAPEKNEVEKSGSLMKLLKIPTVLVTCVITTTNSVTSSYCEPILEPHLRKFSLTPSQVGLLFLLSSATYGLSSPLWGYLTDKLDNYRWLMIAGLFSNSLSLLLLGPSPILTFLEDSLWLSGVALTVLGVTVAMSIIPTYQSILDSAMDSGMTDCLGTHSVIAGVWSSVFSLGEVIGPVSAGTLMDHFGFATTSTVVAALNFVVAMVAMAWFNAKNMKNKLKPDKHGTVNVLYYIENSSDVPASQSAVKSASDDNMVDIRL